MGLPNHLGYFGPYGGRFVPETVMGCLLELEETYKKAKKDKSFQQELKQILSQYSGRPTPLYFAERLTKKWRGSKIYLKREDLNHTGAHKINNCLGQILLAKRMGKKRIIAETGAGQHGVATATVASLFGFKCVIYMGKEDMHRQRLNVLRMKILGAEVITVNSGTATLKDATNEAIRDWVTNVRTTHYIIGSIVGPHPYPMIVRDFQVVIGEETERQILAKEKRLPDYIVACVGGGSNALGIFYPFLNSNVKLIGVESAGKGIDSHFHAASLCKGKPGILHGSYSYLLQNSDGQVRPTYSIAPGLDYPGVGPEHSFLKDYRKVQYVAVPDKEAMRAFSELSQMEGIIPALESCFALAYVKKLAKRLDKNRIVIINLSGRGDKDLEQVEEKTKV